MQGLEAKDIAVNGVQYRLNTLTASVGSEILSKLLGILGDPMGQLFGSGIESELSPEMAGTALGSLGREIAKPGFVKMVKDLLGGLMKNQSGVWVPVNYDIEFAANYGTLSQLIQFALKINFESFFVGNPALQSLASFHREKAPT